MNKIVNNQCTNIKLWHSLFKIHNIYTLNSTPLLIEEPMVSIYIPADTDFEVILWLKGNLKIITITVILHRITLSEFYTE